MPDWFYLARVCGTYNMGSDWFYLAREYVVLRLVMSCQMVCGAYNMGSDWFCLARE